MRCYGILKLAGDVFPLGFAWFEVCDAYLYRSCFVDEVEADAAQEDCGEAVGPVEPVYPVACYLLGYVMALCLRVVFCEVGQRS